MFSLLLILCFFGRLFSPQRVSGHCYKFLISFHCFSGTCSDSFLKAVAIPTNSTYSSFWTGCRFFCFLSFSRTLQRTAKIMWAIIKISGESCGLWSLFFKRKYLHRCPCCDKAWTRSQTVPAWKCFVYDLSVTAGMLTTLLAHSCLYFYKLILLIFYLNKLFFPPESFSVSRSSLASFRGGPWNQASSPTRAVFVM